MALPEKRFACLKCFDIFILTPEDGLVLDDGNKIRWQF
jgi:hypothetical protein